MNPEVPGIVRKVLPRLYEDALLLAVDKPAGVPSGANLQHAHGGLAELLTSVRGGREKLFVVNRLGTNESGVLILAKNEPAARAIRARMRAGAIAQEFVAVVTGRLKGRHFRIDPSHGSSRGRGKPPRPVVRKEGRAAGTSGPRRASEQFGRRAAPGTQVHVLRTEGESALVRCLTTAASTHALLAQLRSAGMFVVGDERPGRYQRRTAPVPLHLHLARIELDAPPQRGRLVLKSPIPRAWNAALAGSMDVEHALRAALAKRLVLFADPMTDAFRLICGAREGLDGIVAEKFGDVVILQVRSDHPQTASSARAAARWYGETLGPRAVVVKSFVKGGGLAQRPPAGPSVSGPAPPPPDQTAIVENGIRFLIRTDKGSAVGLFLDQRENRRRVRELAEGRRVLNLFAYTCGFSVSAALGRAESTTSVDLSPAHLQWGRENFALNRIEPRAHEFFAEDSPDFIKRARRQNRRYGMIILDPPTFAHARRGRRTFSVLADLAELVSRVADVLDPGGILMVSTNHRGMSKRDLQARVKEGARGRRFEVIASPRLPVDFAADPGHAKTLFARFA